MQYLGVILVLTAIGVNISGLEGNYNIFGILVGLIGIAILIKEKTRRD